MIKMNEITQFAQSNKRIYQITESSATCIDNVFLNQDINSFTCKVINPHISDHKGVWVDLDLGFENVPILPQKNANAPANKYKKIK